MRRLPIFALLAFATGATACTEEPVVDDDGDAIEYRQEDPIFDDLGIYVGPSTDSPDCLIWEVTTHPTEPGTNVVAEKSPLGTFDFIMSLHDPAIRDADGTKVCERNQLQLVDTVTPTGDNEVLFTVIGRWVFEGGLDFQGKNRRQIFRQLRRKLLYTIRDEQVFDGAAWRGDVLATATGDIQHSGAMGRMLIAAIVGGECGSSGIDEFEEP